MLSLSASADTDFQFIGARRIGYILSATLLIVSIGSFITRGLELGIDFQGGMEFVVQTDQVLDAVQVREALAEDLSTAPEVKAYGQSDLLIRTLEEGDINEVQTAITTGIATSFADSNPTILKTDIVGPRFAADLKRGAIYSVFGSLLVIFVYILIRFEWRFGAPLA